MTVHIAPLPQRAIPFRHDVLVNVTGRIVHMGDRQTKRTTKQMIEAPLDACFVWCNDRLSYPRNLAQHLGRSDLTIISPEQDRPSFHSGRGWKVVRDHALGQA